MGGRCPHPIAIVSTKHNRIKTFESKCEITRKMPPFYFAKGEGYVDGKLAVKAEFSFALVKG